MVQCVRTVFLCFGGSVVGLSLPVSGFPASTFAALGIELPVSRRYGSKRMSIAELEQMPREEKVRLMEALWADLSRNDEAFEAPAWHGDVLRETAERLAAGSEQVLDWAEAKDRLRSRP